MAIKSSTIRTLYFYVLSAIGLIMVSFSTADLINTALKTWVFPKAEEVYYVCPSRPPSPRPSPIQGEGELDPETQRKQCLDEEKHQLEQQIRHRQSSAVRDFSFLVVGIPLFWFHFRVVQRERRDEKDNGGN